RSHPADLSHAPGHPATGQPRLRAQRHLQPVRVATAVGALAGLVVGCIVIVGCVWGAGVGAAIGAVVGINNGDPRAGQAILNWINTP
ncbi:hypothetical protein ACWDNR_23075, partial [Gordonia aichiensis]